MVVKSDQSRFLHSPAARILALVLAAALLLLGFLVFQDEFGKPLLSESGTIAAPELPIVQEKHQPVESCIERRIAYINGLVRDELMSEEQAEISRSRARNLCSEREGLAD